MRPGWTVLARQLVGLFAIVSLLASIFTAGHAYFFCHMSEEVQAHCCCLQTPQQDSPQVDRNFDCCELRTHAAPGEAIQPVSAPIAAAYSAASLGAPLAVVPRVEGYVSRPSLLDWTGPPLNQRRALISVRLL